VGALVTVVLNLEKLNLLYERERSDWMSTETELRGEIENARASLKKAESSFVVALREKDLKVTRARREIFIWKLISGAFVSGIVYIAVMR
jgi:predicted negative regulator of RcsB-dependent stress response